MNWATPGSSLSIAHKMPRHALEPAHMLNTVCLPMMAVTEQRNPLKLDHLHSTCTVTLGHLLAHFDWQLPCMECIRGTLAELARAKLNFAQLRCLVASPCSCSE